MKDQKKYKVYINQRLIYHWKNQNHIEKPQIPDNLFLYTHIFNPISAKIKVLLL